MPISGVNLTPRPTAVYASDPALPRRPQDSLPSCLLGFERTRLALASSYQLPIAPRTGLLSKVRRIRGLGSSSGSWAQAVGDMPIPALCPGHALALALPSTLPSTLSATSLSAGVVRGFFGTLQPPPTFRSGFGSSPSRTGPGPPWRLRAAGGLPGSDTILDGSNWSQTPVERLAERSRTCCLRRFAAPRPPR